MKRSSRNITKLSEVWYLSQCSYVDNNYSGATQESFDLVSVPAGADNVSYWTWKVISQWGSLCGRMFGACLSTVPLWSVFLAVTFPSRGHSSETLTRGRHQQWAAEGETLWQEEGLEQIDLWTPQVPLHCLLAEGDWDGTYTRTCTHKHA